MRSYSIYVHPEAWRAIKRSPGDVEHTEDYEQIIREIVDHMTLEQRLAGIAPEQRLAGLDRDHQALALSVDVLRVLPEEYIRSLSVEVQEEIRRRIRSGRA